MNRYCVGLALTALSLTAACDTTGGFDVPDTVTPPGIAPGEQAVDGLIVGQRLMDAGEYELALQAYSRAVLDHGMSTDVLAGLGSANLGLGRLGQAEKLLRDAIATDGAVPQTWNNLGVVLMEKGEFHEAVQFFKRAYALDNGESDAIRDNLRLALAKLENPVYGEAQEQQYKVVRRGSSDFLIRRIP
ncbi:MAG: tetratricopeptide repeat protein [Thalassovita sp.]